MARNPLGLERQTYSKIKFPLDPEQLQPLQTGGAALGAINGPALARGGFFSYALLLGGPAVSVGVTIGLGVIAAQVHSEFTIEGQTLFILFVICLLIHGALSLTFYMLVSNRVQRYFYTGTSDKGGSSSLLRGLENSGQLFERPTGGLWVVPLKILEATILFFTVINPVMHHFSWPFSYWSLMFRSWFVGLAFSLAPALVLASRLEIYPLELIGLAFVTSPTISTASSILTLASADAWSGLRNGTHALVTG